MSTQVRIHSSGGASRAVPAAVRSNSHAPAVARPTRYAPGRSHRPSSTRGSDAPIIASRNNRPSASSTLTGARTGSWPQVVVRPTSRPEPATNEFKIQPRSAAFHSRPKGPAPVRTKPAASGTPSIGAAATPSIRNPPPARLVRRTAGRMEDRSRSRSEISGVSRGPSGCSESKKGRIAVRRGNRTIHRLGWFPSRRDPGSLEFPALPRRGHPDELVRIGRGRIESGVSRRILGSSQRDRGLHPVSPVRIGQGQVRK